MTTRPLRHADDTAQELINLRHRRDLLHQELEWLEAVIADMERRGGESDVTGAHQPQSVPCRSIVEEGRQMDPPDRS